MRNAIATPWGPSQHITTIAPGIEFVSTARHGGFRLNTDTARKMAPDLRGLAIITENGYYFEEDCAYSAILINFPELCRNPEELLSAKRILAGCFNIIR